MNYTETITDNEGRTAFTNGDHTPAREIIVRMTGTFTPAPRNYIGNHRKAEP